MLTQITKRIVPLVLTFAISMFAVAELEFMFRPDLKPLVSESRAGRKMDLLGSGSSGPHDSGFGSSGPGGIGIGGSTPVGQAPRQLHEGIATTPYKITFQPKAVYTDAARVNGTQGAVRLKVTLLASGQIGSVIAVTELPDGLTERAIAAARQIRFEPKRVNGVPVSVAITREYTFTIY